MRDAVYSLHIGMSTSTPKPRLVSPNFITEIIDEDLKAGRYKKIVTRFPPSPTATPTWGTPLPAT